VERGADVNKQNRLLVTIAALWAVSIGAAVAYLVLARETVHRFNTPPTRVFDWTALYLWIGAISAAAILAVALTLVWTETTE
jgi:hypothetical protein